MKVIKHDSSEIVVQTVLTKEQLKYLLIKFDVLVWDKFGNDYMRITFDPNIKQQVLTYIQNI